MVRLKQVAIDGHGVVALPGYICWAKIRSGALQQVLPTCLASDSTVAELVSIPARTIALVSAFIDNVVAAAQGRSLAGHRDVGVSGTGTVQ
jgi:hypothetical protein